MEVLDRISTGNLASGYLLAATTSPTFPSSKKVHSVTTVLVPFILPKWPLFHCHRHFPAQRAGRFAFVLFLAAELACGQAVMESRQKSSFSPPVRIRAGLSYISVGNPLDAFGSTTSVVFEPSLNRSEPLSRLPQAVRSNQKRGQSVRFIYITCSSTAT